MKKLLFIFIFVFIFAGLAFEAPPSDDYNIYNYNDVKKESYQSIGNINAYYLGGFDFNGYNSTYPGLERMTRAEVKAVVTGVKTDGTVIRKAPDSYGIVGYSQGGLRALAFSTHLKANYSESEYKKLKAVVTYSGIDQGIQTLQDDLPGVRSRIMDEVNILSDGVDAFFATGLTPIINSILVPLISTIKVTASSNILMDIVLSFLPAEVKGYIAPTMLGTGKTANQLGLSQLNDMKPGSGYIKNYVADSSTSICKVKIGSLPVIKIKIVNLKPVIYIEYTPVYINVSYTHPVVKFPSDLPVGFIVGTNNSLKSKADKEAPVVATAKTLETVFDITEKFHIVNSIAIIGLITGSPAYASKANKAKQMVGNIDAMITYVTRSSDGDGLIARGNQYYPRVIKDPAGNEIKLLTNVLSKDEYMPVYANHADIDDNQDTYANIRTLFSTARLIK
jgi:hypothetical protein